MIFVEAPFKPFSVSSFLYAEPSHGRCGRGLLRKFSLKGNQGLFSHFFVWIEVFSSEGKKIIRPFSPSGILYLR